MDAPLLTKLQEEEPQSDVEEGLPAVLQRNYRAPREPAPRKGAIAQELEDYFDEGCIFCYNATLRFVINGVMHTCIIGLYVLMVIAIIIKVCEFDMDHPLFNKVADCIFKCMAIVLFAMFPLMVWKFFLRLVRVKLYQRGEEESMV